MDKEVRAFSPEMVAQLYGLNKGSLANWRHQKVGPRYYKVNRKVIYMVGDIEEWIRQRPVLTRDSMPEND